jgi:Zn-dependent peptidase ImmA (M78 family)
MALRRGFKAEAETIAAEIRSDLRISLYSRLDPHLLAGHLDIQLWPLSWLNHGPSSVEGLGEAITYLTAVDTSAFSAVTVFCGTVRTIVHNDGQSLARQASNISHEAAHALLLHPPGPALDRRGCRLWNADVEDEANWLGGTLLIPGPAARRAARQRLSLDQIADHFGCSTEMARWRLNMTGARRLQTA